MKGKTLISKLTSRHYKFEDDVNYKKRGGRTKTKTWARSLRAKLKSIFKREYESEV